MTDQHLVPKLRFQGFTDAWAQRKLGDYAAIATGKLDANAMVEDGEYDFYTSGIKKYRIDKAAFEGPAITIAGNGATVGYMHLANGKFNAYQRTYVLSKLEADRQFLFAEIGNRLPSKIAQEARTGNIPYIVMDMLTDLKLGMPTSDEEQSKIGKMFQLLDEIIALNKRKLECLKALKKALIQRLFPLPEEYVPRLRFHGYVSDWQPSKFSSLAAVRRGLTYQPADVLEHGTRVLRSSNINEDTFTIWPDDIFVNPDAVNIKMAAPGDILITSANGSNRLVGKHAIITEIPGNAVPGGFMLLAHTKQPDFVNSLMSSAWYDRFILTYVAGGNGAIGNLNKGDLDSQVVAAPEDAEKSQIGAVFRLLDAWTTAQQNRVDNLAALKATLLQQMFV